MLIRLSPRPLSVRAWRVADMKGALNAAVAHAMVHLTKPQAADNFLNLTCGSGTLLVERLLAAPARRLIGCDIDATALQYAQANLKAAQLQDRVELYDWDARSLNLPDRSVDAICADLPFGIAVGAHAQNVAHYPAILAEAARRQTAGPLCTDDPRGYLAGSAGPG
ncbi:MAG: methyltransferase domain-containing protein [Caldilineaceae bacterium]